MGTRLVRTICLGLALTLSAVLTACTPQTAEPPLSPTPVSTNRTPLDEYVDKLDPAFQWELAETIQGEGYTAFILDLKSQSWRSADEVDRTLWQHWLTIVRPDEVKTNTGLMLIGHRNNDGKTPDFVDEIVTEVALGAGAVVAQVGQVPNQPLTFAGETKGRTEDAQIAYAWDKYLDTGDPLWASRMPMVKATVRAMDATQAFMSSEAGGGIAVNGFIVAGASKRGWTTWITGAVDRRVAAIIPMVIDVVNVVESMRHHHASYGDWAEALAPYLEMDIMSRLDTPEFKALMDLVDPYAYLDRLTMPKYIVNATGDQLFLPDSSRFYLDALKGEKHLRYVPNTDHFVDEKDTVLSYVHAIVNGTKLPEVSWSLTGPGTLRVASDSAPEKVLLWQATNAEARDFRLETIGEAWTSSHVEAQTDGAYVAQVAVPEAGRTAFFVELTYDLGAPVPFVATTDVRIIPDVYPDGTTAPERTKD